MGRLVDIDSIEYYGGPECMQWTTRKSLEENVIGPGRWLEVFDDFSTRWKCSCCGRWQEYKTAFCCHCGRKMEDKGE